MLGEACQHAHQNAQTQHKTVQPLFVWLQRLAGQWCCHGDGTETARLHPGLAFLHWPVAEP